MLEHHQTQRLLDIAFLGCINGQVGLSRQVVKGLSTLLPDSPELEICRAMSFYAVDQFDKALDVLTGAAQAFPGNEMIKVHKALTLTLKGEKGEARLALDGVVKENRDKDAVKLAQVLLDEAC